MQCGYSQNNGNLRKHLFMVSTGKRRRKHASVRSKGACNSRSREIHMIKQGILTVLGIVIGGFLLTLLVGNAYGIDNISIPYRWAEGDTIWASEVLGNSDSIAAKSNRFHDTVGLKFLRTSDMDD